MYVINDGPVDETQVGHARRLALDSGMADRVQFYEQERTVHRRIILIVVKVFLAITKMQLRPIGGFILNELLLKCKVATVH